jgi:hypothetical protein
MLNNLVSFAGSIMNMNADVYIQQNTQDPNTGEITRAWIFYQNIQCRIEPVKARGASTRTDNKTFGSSGDEEYNEKFQLKMYGQNLLSKRWRIQNIRTNHGQPVFIEIDRSGNPDTIFEVMSSHAVLDPFGTVSYYVSVLLRTELQDDSQA